MHILFVCRAFHNMAGGIEFSSALIMNEMIRRGHRVSLISWDQAGPRPFFELSPQIEWRKLDLGDPWAKAGPGLKLKRLLKMRRFIKQAAPDVLVAFHDDCFTLSALATAGLSVPLIAAERCPPSRFEFSIKGTKRNILNLLLRRAKRITVFFERYRAEYPPALRARIVPIANMVFPVSRPADPAGENAAVKSILYIGRFSYEKNPHVLIKAFSLLAAMHPDWMLDMAGDGPERSSVEKLIKQYGLENRVRLHGQVKDVQSLYERAQIFCFPSRWEGFGNALAEALAYGLPCTGFAECSGVRDLIEHGRAGLLAEGMDDAQTLAGALETLMINPALRAEMGAQARQSVAKFQPESVYTQWENLLTAVRA